MHIIDELTAISTRDNTDPIVFINDMHGVFSIMGFVRASEARLV